MSLTALRIPCKPSLLVSSSPTLLPALSIYPLTGPSISRRFRHDTKHRSRDFNNYDNNPYSHHQQDGRRSNAGTEPYSRDVSWSKRSYGFSEPHSRRKPWSNDIERNKSKVPKHFRHGKQAAAMPMTIESPTYDQIPDFFVKAAGKWASDSATRHRLFTFGVPSSYTGPLLLWYSKAVKRGDLTSSPELISKYTLERLMQPLDNESLDIICSTVFFQYISQLSEADISSCTVPRNILIFLRRIAEAADRQFIMEEFPIARAIRRKVIMHVGPTNSGKTYHALRALAAAPKGVYAGPLRLLAHEIWDRLNKGMICPLGMDPNAPSPPTLRDALAEEDSDSTALDLPPNRPHLGNPHWARLCNMLTGEEHKVVSPNAPLLSCTVEMLSKTTYHDVAVIDEIQMINDSGRGFAWTEALLGTNAKELHLCGEETAVPIVRELLKDTGDELIVNHYKRLTPLTVEEESLKGDWSKVQKGDCVVAFSRNGIFSIKKKIENTTGMKCAVVYGKLPPEIRSEQAALFNDPDSGYDVIVGSDAIGMGLNLKIRRMIFDAVSKRIPSGYQMLSVSSVKQIAGRAGRFGMGSEAGGFTTTFKEGDLTFLRNTMTLDPTPLPYARVGVSEESFARLAAVLPPEASTATVYNAHLYAGRLPASLRYVEASLIDQVGKFIDSRASTNRLTISERLMLMNAPISWRDPNFLDLVDNLMREYHAQGEVNFFKAMEKTEYPRLLSTVQEQIENDAKKDQEKPPNSRLISILMGLETYHKVAVLYMWMGQRNPVVWPQLEIVQDVKERMEYAMEWCLLQMSETKGKEAATGKDSITPAKQSVVDESQPDSPRVAAAAS